MYAKIESGSVVDWLNQLPKQHTFADGSKIGNFDILPEAKQVEEGYYPVIDETPVYDATYEELQLGDTMINADNVTRTYVKVLRDLDIMKGEKLDHIEALRQEKLKKGTFTVGAPVNDTFVFRNNGEGNTTLDVMKAKMAADAGLLDLTSFTWTNSVGEEVVLGVLGFPVFMAAAATYEATIDATAKYKRGEVKALTTQQEVAAYDPKTGW